MDQQAQEVDLKTLDTPKLAASRLKVCERTLQRWAVRGKIRHLKTPAGHWRYDVDAFLAEHLK